MIFRRPAYQPIADEQTAKFEYGVEAGSDISYGSTVYYAFACGDPSYEDSLQLDMLSYMFNDVSSPFSEGLYEALPAAEGNCYLEIAGPEMAVVFTATGVNEGEEETFRKVVDDAIAAVANDGLNPDMVDAVAASIDMKMLLTMEGENVGVDLTEKIAYSWASMDTLDAFDLPDAVKRRGRGDRRAHRGRRDISGRQRAQRACGHRSGSRAQGKAGQGARGSARRG